MFKNMKKQLNNEKGLTLIELLAVIVILAIIAAIAVPAIGNIIQNTREKAFVADAQNVLSAANLYFVENTPTADTATTKVTIGKLIADDFLTEAGSIKNATVTFVAGDENTITASGTAGNKTVSISAKTNRDLSDDGRGALDTTPNPDAGAEVEG
jgi:type IV pilus assembly protein PilA